MTDHMQHIQQLVVPQLVAVVKARQAEEPTLLAAALVFDAPTALRTGLATAAEVGEKPDPGVLVPKLMPCDQIARFCADEPRLTDWIVPPGEGYLLVVVRTLVDCAVWHVPLDGARTAAPPDPWRHLSEQEQAHSLWLKHRERLLEEARVKWREQPGLGMAAIVLAPELARRAKRDGAPVAGESTGELATLATRPSVEQMLAGEPVHLRLVEDAAPDQLPIVIGTEHGWMVRVEDLAG